MRGDPVIKGGILEVPILSYILYGGRNLRRGEGAWMIALEWAGGSISNQQLLRRPKRSVKKRRYSLGRIKTTVLGLGGRECIVEWARKEPKKTSIHKKGILLIGRWGRMTTSARVDLVGREDHFGEKRGVT